MSYFYARSVPTKLRLGYYTPKPVEDDDGKQTIARFSHLTSSSNYRIVPRLAIVRRKHFPLSPLEHLAMTAADELLVPFEVVADIAGAIAEWNGGSREDPIDNEWDWIKSFKLRFKLRIKRGKLETAVQRRKNLQLTRLYQRRSDACDARDRAERLRKEREEEIKDLDEKIKELRSEVDR